jgi:hypothetical protein
MIIRAFKGFRTRDPSRRAAADPHKTTRVACVMALSSINEESKRNVFLLVTERCIVQQTAVHRTAKFVSYAGRQLPDKIMSLFQPAVEQ